MITDIFLPEKIKNSYLFGQQHLGIEINKSSINATLTHISGTTATIKDFYTEPLGKNSEDGTEQDIKAALKRIFEKAGDSCRVHLTLANNLAIFKELTVPFVDQEHIAQILPFELESQIPFPITDVVFDFVITAQDILQKKSTLLVGIVTKKDLDWYLSQIESAGCSVQAVTLDVFAFYTLYSAYAAHKNNGQPAVLFDIGFSYTTVAYSNSEKLVAIRTIAQGINTLAKNIAEKSHESPANIVEFVSRFGFASTDNPMLTTAIAQELDSFAKSIKFTLDAFSAQLVSYDTPQHATLITRGAPIKALDKQLSELIGITTEFMDTQEILQIKNLKTRSGINQIPLTHVMCLGAAYPFATASSFNLLAYQKTTATARLIQKQFIVTIFMIVAILALTIGYSYLQHTRASSHINNAKRNALRALKEAKGLNIEANDLKKAIEDAEEKLKKSEEIWAGIAGQSRLSYLKYLQELTTKIDRNAIGLELKKLSIIPKNKTITLKGHVQSNEKVSVFKNELSESELFTLASAPQEPEFDITLVIKESSQEPA